MKILSCAYFCSSKKKLTSFFIRFKKRPLVGWAVVFGVLVSCAAPSSPQTEFVLGTVCSINLFEYGRPEQYRALFARLREIEDRMSVNKTGTELDAVNEAAGRAPVPVHPDTYYVVEKALEYARVSGGAFDPTVGPLVKLWGIGTEDAHVPNPSEIEGALKKIDYKKVLLDSEHHTIYLTEKGMALDLGAIAKGFAADELAAMLRQWRIRRALIDLGGNILVVGEKQDGTPWRIGVQDPRSGRGEYIGIVQIKRDKTTVTSGVYERYFEQNGKRYHHILSTRNGYPVQNGLLSVTVVADRSIDADALSTTVFALGYEKGLSLLETLDVGGIFIFENQEVAVTSNLSSQFQLTNTAYRLRPSR
ncbi:MAG TPA: FAD:protein FMN transferase [Termitinemataceae bacterium]|nr:FAD:protein FMN transferase [Termitinemataceae bacterium]